MANHLFDLLSRWHSQRDHYDWVLISVIDVHGSNYRRSGAMMLISEFGQALGLISGGCLEKSLLPRVKKVLSSGQSLKVEIDSSSEGDWPALGCGGRVNLWLQLVNQSTQYQQLDQLYLALIERKKTYYAIGYTHSSKILSQNQLWLDQYPPIHAAEYLLTHPKPQRHLGIFGGGIDAVPLVNFASLMGWKVSLIESRSGFGLTEDFPAAQIIRADAQSNSVKSLVNLLDAAVIMTHNLELDAAALKILPMQNLSYVGLLGPRHRREKVFALANLIDDLKIHGPMGLNLGGDLPESVALSVMAQIHQTLEARDRDVDNNLRAQE